MPANGYYARHIGPIRDFFVSYLTDISRGLTIVALRERLLFEIDHIDRIKDGSDALQKAVLELERECYKQLLTKISDTSKLNQSIEKIIRQVADDAWKDMKEAEYV